MLSPVTSSNMAQTHSQAGSQGDHYFMSGERGFCKLCNIELTSRQHCMQHIGGKNHQKKVLEAESKVAFGVPDNNNSAQQNESRLTTLTFGVNGEEYVLNPAGGRCFICGVDFNSHTHGVQHLSGTRHLKKSASRTFQGALGLSQSASLGLSYFPTAFQQASPLPNQSNSQLAMTDVSTDLPPFTPQTGPNGELYVMRGTRGYCYICDIELTSREHAQSHLSGSKHAKKSSGRPVSSPDSMFPPPGKVLMCSLCQVPFSGMRNAQEHFQSEKHKKKAQALSLSEPDYSDDPEQTVVMRPYPSPSTRTSTPLNTVCQPGASTVNSSETSRKFPISAGVFNHEKIGNTCQENPQSHYLPVAAVKSNSSLCQSESDYNGVINPIQYCEILEIVNSASEIDPARVSALNLTLEKQSIPTNVDVKKSLDDNFMSNLNEVRKTTIKSVDMKSPMESLTDNTLQPPKGSYTDNVAGTMHPANSSYKSNLQNTIHLAGGREVPFDNRSSVLDNQRKSFLGNTEGIVGASVQLEQLKLEQTTTLNDHALGIVRGSLIPNVSEPSPRICHSGRTFSPEKLTSMKEEKLENPVEYSHKMGLSREENSRSSTRDKPSHYRELTESNFLTRQQNQAVAGPSTTCQEIDCKQAPNVSPHIHMANKMQGTIKQEVRSEHDQYTPHSSKQSGQSFAPRVLYFTPSRDQQQTIDCERNMESQPEINEPTGNRKETQNKFMPESKFIGIKKDHAAPMTKQIFPCEDLKINNIADDGRVSSESSGLVSTEHQINSSKDLGVTPKQDNVSTKPDLEENSAEKVCATPKALGSCSNQQLTTEMPSSGQAFFPNTDQVSAQDADHVTSLKAGPVSSFSSGQVLFLSASQFISQYSSQNSNRYSTVGDCQFSSDGDSQIASQSAGLVSSPSAGLVSSSNNGLVPLSDPSVVLRPAEIFQRSGNDDLSEAMSRLEPFRSPPPSQATTDAPGDASSSPLGHEQPDIESQLYVFNGSRGYCRVCNLDLSSLQHTNQHINGQKHKKKAAQFYYTQALQQGAPAPFTSPSATMATIQTTSTNLALFPQMVAPDDKPYTFNGAKGYCFVCQIELSSYPHANQHLNGKSHKRNLERANMAKQGIEYPNYCNVCRKRFTGTESAAQHFTSVKHKTKAHLVGEDVMTVKLLDEGRVILKDGQVWYFCDVCQCPVNTEEQFVIHKETTKHKKESEAKQASQSEPVLTTESPAPGPQCYLQNVPRSFNPGTPVPHHVIDENRHHLTYGESPVISTGENIGSKQLTPPRENVITNAGVTAKGRPILGGGAAVMSNFGAPQTAFQLINIPVERYTAQINPIALTQQPGPGSSEDYLHIGNSTGFVLHHFGTIGDKRGTSNGGGSGSGGGGSSGGSGRGQSFENSQGQSRRQPTSGGGSGLGTAPGYGNSQGQGRGEPTGGGGLVKQSNDGQGATGREEDSFSDGESDGFGHTVRQGNDGFMKTPSRTQRSVSRRDNGPRDVISMDKLEEDDGNDDDSYAEEEQRKNMNIHEEVEKSPQPRPAPERSTKHGFRYYCRICDKHMNTLDNYNAHVKGSNHLYMSSVREAPVRNLDQIVKKFDEIPQHHDLFNICTTFPRTYQVELVKKTMAGDKIVYLPTGTGKTLVAVMTMALMLKENPSRPVLFLVDKVLLVLQQTNYIKKQLEGKQFLRTDLKDGNTREVRDVVIKAICGGLTSKSDLPVWKFDIVVTTAAFCHNMLQKKIIRWEDFSLVVLDEVHHCNKHHPYHKLLSGFHSNLPPGQRAKMLGLTASPAGKTTEIETYQMLRGLLNNLGGASVAIVEDEEDTLKEFKSNAEVHAMCVPMSNREREFRLNLLEYMVMCYSKFAPLSSLRDVRTPPCSFLLEAVLNPLNRQVAKQIAENFLKDEEPLSELLIQINMAACLTKDNQDIIFKFNHLKLHLERLLLTIPEVGTGANFIEELAKVLAPSDVVKVFESMGLPCKEMLDNVKLFEVNGKKDNTMFTKLIEILQDQRKIKITEPTSKALVLVRERKIARQIGHKLREEPLIKDNNLRVTHLVGHGNAKDHGMDVKKQKRVLDNQERYNIFVATSIMEEGVDFQSLQLVVSMNPPTSMRALVQIRGRARKKDSHFVILCSSEEEVIKFETLQLQEKNMQAAAKRCVEEDRPAAQLR